MKRQSYGLRNDDHDDVNPTGWLDNRVEGKRKGAAVTHALLLRLAS